MNRGRLEVRVNHYPWHDVNFYKMEDRSGTFGFLSGEETNGDFGSLSCRNVDLNGDGKITTDDNLDGAYFFAYTKPGQFARGMNLVRLRYTDGSGKVLDQQLFIMYNVQRAVAFECDNTGTPLAKNTLLQQSVQWSMLETYKDLTLGFTNNNLDLTDCNCALEGDQGDDFTEVSDAASLTPGTYAFETIGSGENTKILMKIRIGRDQLLTESSGEITLMQTLNVHTRINDGGNPIDMYFPFVIDNEAPVISVFSPNLELDINKDGLITAVAYPDGDDVNGDGAVDGTDRCEVDRIPDGCCCLFRG